MKEVLVKLHSMTHDNGRASFYITINFPIPDEPDEIVCLDISFEGTKISPWKKITSTKVRKILEHNLSLLDCGCFGIINLPEENVNVLGDVWVFSDLPDLRKVLTPHFRSYITPAWLKILKEYYEWDNLETDYLI